MCLPHAYLFYIAYTIMYTAYWSKLKKETKMKEENKNEPVKNIWYMYCINSIVCNKQ